MKITRFALFCLLITCGAFAQAAPLIYLQSTGDISAYKKTVRFQNCDNIILPLPDAGSLTLYDDQTFVEEANFDGNISQRTGYWNVINDSGTKFQFTYDGNPADGTGSWGVYISYMEALAGQACSGIVEGLGAALRVKKWDLTIKQTGNCIGTTKFQFQAEGYGYNLTYNETGKGSDKASSAGVFLLGPGYTGPLYCI